MFHRALSLSLLVLLGVGCSDADPRSPTSPPPADTRQPLACEAPTGPGTVHSGDVQGDEVWTAAAGPHIVEGDVRVRNGSKLTVEPCAVVRFARGKSLTVAYPLTPNEGELIAEGTAERPIRFEGLDGARWGAVSVRYPGTARLAHVTIEGGGDGSFNASLVAHGDNVLPSKPILSVKQVTVKNSASAGVRVEQMSTFTPDSVGLTVTGSGNEAHPYPLELHENAINNAPEGSYTGNRKDEILVNQEEKLQENTVMRDLGVRWHMGNSTVDKFVIGGGSKSPLTTLTIEPGVTLAFERHSGMRVEHWSGEFAASGAVIAVGTPEKPIVFTSAAETPAPGDWQGLWFGGVPRDTNRFDHVRFEYTGDDCGCILATCSAISRFEGAVIFSQKPPAGFITNADFSKGAGHGVVLGYLGAPVDFASSNRFDAMAGCATTLPGDNSCPSPRPSCLLEERAPTRIGSADERDRHR
jgi:hypothetical protein